MPCGARCDATWSVIICHVGCAVATRRVWRGARMNVLNRRKKTSLEIKLYKTKQL